MVRLAWGALVLSAVLLSTPAAHAQQLPWSFAIVGPEARRIRQLPLLERPNRPGHIYGNTVRRMHYRGHPFPVPCCCSHHDGIFFRRW